MSLRSGKKKKSPQKNIYSVHFSPIQGNTAVHKGQWEDCTFKSHLMSFCGERECSPCVCPDINIVLKFQKQSHCYGLRAITRPIILPLTIYSLCCYRGTCFCCAARSRLRKSTLLAWNLYCRHVNYSCVALRSTHRKPKQRSGGRFIGLESSAAQKKEGRGIAISKSRPKTCILLCGQQGAPKMVAKRRRMLGCQCGKQH